MKTLSTIALSLALSAVGVQAHNVNDTTLQSGDPINLPAPTAYRVVDIGANHQIWQRETYAQAPNGKIVTHVHKYTELATGMHYKNADGQWVDSQELIEPSPNGAIANRGQYQVSFENN